MKKIILICFLLLIVGMCFTGCTLKEKETESTTEQSVLPHIEYEIPDKVDDYDFDYEFVPENGQEAQP